MHSDYFLCCYGCLKVFELIFFLQNIQQHRPCDLIGSAAGWWRNRPGPCVGHLGVGRPGHCTETGWKWPTGKRRKHKISNWYQNYICKNKFLWEEEIATFHWWISTSSKVDFFLFHNSRIKGSTSYQLLWINMYLYYNTFTLKYF